MRRAVIGLTAVGSLISLLLGLAAAQGKIRPTRRAG
jgi:hypothetical protein